MSTHTWTKLNMGAFLKYLAKGQIEVTRFKNTLKQAHGGSSGQIEMLNYLDRENKLKKTQKLFWKKFVAGLHLITLPWDNLDNP